MNSFRLDVRFGIIAFALLAVVAASGCVDPPSSGDPQNLTPDEAAALIEEHAGDPNFVIVDVRNPEEFARGHIQDAVNICYLCSTFADSIGSLDKSRTYLVYCGTEHRSPLAVEAMKNAGFTNLYNMTGGLIDWQARALPVVQ